MQMISMSILLVLLAGSHAAFAQKAKATSKESKASTTITTNYICPMHPDISMDKPGKCSKCGMDLTISKKEQMKMEVMKLYTCPMHPDVVGDKAGTCSKCGMDLVEKKTYTCSMHPDIISNKAGACSKCGMELVEKKTSVDKKKKTKKT